MPEHILNKIFKENLRYLPKWNGALANHVSMAAVALFKMKEWVPIDDDKIIREANKYMRGLTPLRLNSSSIDLSRLNWEMQKGLLGHDEYYESWKDFFLQQLKEKDNKEMIGIWLARLGVGLSAAAGHSIIRLAYALKAETYLTSEVYTEEIATCLADLASRYFPLSSENLELEAEQTVTLDQYVLDHAPLPDEKLSLLSTCSLIEDKFFLCRNFSEFQNALSQVNIDFEFHKVLNNLSSIAVTNPNFALLHCITIAHAIIYLSDNLPVFDIRNLYHGYRDFVIAALLCNNLSIQPFEHKEVTLDQVYSQISKLENDHSQKIAFTLTELYKRYSAPIFLQAALSYIP